MGFGASKGLILGFCLALGLMAAPARADDDTPYTVSKIAVDVTAKNAVAAKAKAMADAQKRGIDTVLRRVVPFSFSAKLPDLQPQQVETLVNGMAIRKEQYSTTRYIATLDVIFNEQGVKELLASLGIPTSEERAPMISILPLVIDGNKVKSVNEPWRQAWLDLDLSHGLTPANVLQPRPELEAGMVRAVLAGDAGAFAAVQRDYGSAPLIIAVGQKVDGGRFVTRLAGTDGVGRINYGRSDKARWNGAQGGAGGSVLRLCGPGESLEGDAGGARPCRRAGELSRRAACRRLRPLRNRVSPGAW